MTDADLLNRVLSCIDPGQTAMRGLRRNGRLLLALPPDKEAAARALGLYQPQRPAARVMVTGLRALTGIGLQGCVLPKLRTDAASMALSPALSGIETGSCGVLLGSPEHRVRRAIVSYHMDGRWEVAKIFFGDTGAQLLEQEARTLEELQSLASGPPPMLGLHRGDQVTVMRMQYLTGRPIPPGESSAALELLGTWVTGQVPKPITGFPEWAAIKSALSKLENGQQVIGRLSLETVHPVIRHGDFARWNLLRQEDGKLVVLDWEWGHADGMPGIDLVHYFLQDARLVERLSPAAAISKTCSILESPSCRDYLARTGWTGDPLLPIIASLAYKQGAGHQENWEVLKAAVARF